MSGSNLAQNQQTDEHIISDTAKRLDSHLDQDSGSNELRRALEMTGLLQSTLDVTTLIEFFTKETKNSIEFSGLHYQFSDHDIDIRHGHKHNFRYNYRLLVGTYPLGDLTLFRETELDSKETLALEYLLSSLLYPLRNSILYLNALKTARKDPLTGINNRCAFDETFKREMDMAQRHETPFSLLIVDIDHFKNVNDSFGHLYGDCVLREVAQRIEQCIRSTDILFRYGGEEFAILLSNTPTSGAQLTAERIRRSMKTLNKQSESGDNITVSIGGAEQVKGDDANTFFKRADDALYQAKDNGRNCVCFKKN